MRVLRRCRLCDIVLSACRFNCSETVVFVLPRDLREESTNVVLNSVSWDTWAHALAVLRS